MHSMRIIVTALLFLAIIGCSKTDEKKITNSDNHFQFNYSVTVPQSVDSFTKGEIYIPIPQTNNYQEIHNFVINTNGSYEIMFEPEYKNQFAKITFDDSLQADLNLSLQVDITRKENNNGTTKQFDTIENPKVLERFLMADSLVPIDGVVASEALALINDEMTTKEKAKAFYDHLVQTMVYDKSGEGWGRGDALYACDIRKGNCTDFHSLFIGMARSVGIPARFHIGFPLPASEKESTIGGYHCWAEFYVEGNGWIPVDISEAYKHPENKEYLFGNLDYNRLTFSTGRDILIPTEYGEKSLNFFIYPQVYIDGRLSDNFEKKFEFKKL